MQEGAEHPPILIDMVHHNPGESLTCSKFSRPEVLKSYGYTGQVFKHINTVIEFNQLNAELFLEGEESRVWLDSSKARIKEEIRQAKLQELQIYYHIDLFVLPKKLVEKYKEQLCEAGTNRVSLHKEFTLRVHQLLFDELFANFPEVDGLIVRVGETYLADTPYHIGNGPIYKHEYVSSGAEQSTAEIESYQKLISFLREEVCVKHNKQLLFRTWDCFPDKFHANLDYYLQITDAIQPHPNLIFSIKHTALDFWRRVRFNPCLTRGKHSQIVEVQCQREYEGKGAHPNYIMDGIINGFEDNKLRMGLADIVNHPLIRGVYSWSRGGGWQGPYITNELWCDLHVYVLAGYMNRPSATEQELFAEFTHHRLGLSGKMAERFRSICILSARAVLQGRYCEAYDEIYQESYMPTHNWMRDDTLGGMDQLVPVFELLAANGQIDQAIAEKWEAAALWNEMERLAHDVTLLEREADQFFHLSITYGRLLYTIVAIGWELLSEGYRLEQTGYCHDQDQRMRSLLTAYDESWASYRELRQSPLCPSLYTEEYLHTAGMGTSVEQLREKLSRLHHSTIKEIIIEV